MKRWAVAAAAVIAVCAAAVLLIGTGCGVKLGSAAGIVRKPPMPEIHAGDREIPAIRGTYSWKWLGGGVAADYPTPSDVYESMQKEGMLGENPVKISPGAKLKVDFKYKPQEVSVNRWVDGKAARVEESGGITLPEEKGIYIYDVWARWKEGAGSFVFFVEVAGNN